jgi:hypothetical protein
MDASGEDAGGDCGQSCALASPDPCVADPDSCPPEPRSDGLVPTQRYDNFRSGANLTETTLNTSNVNVAQFGKLTTHTLRGSVYAQPLFVRGVHVPAIGARDVVYAATMRNYVYALDPHDPARAPYWVRQLGPAVQLPDDEIGGAHYRDVWGPVGIVSTPVVSISQRAIYVVAYSKANAQYSHRLYKLDLATGRDLVPPVTFEEADFDSRRANQRASLLLASNTIYVAFAAYGDRPPYHGWIFAFAESDLRSIRVFNDTPTGAEGGIWMGGTGPSADRAGNVFAISGDGSFSWNAADPMDTSGLNLGNSFLKFDAKLNLTDWFTPSNVSVLNAQDGDLGGSGALLVPGSSRVIGAGKEGVVYVLDRSRLGFHRSDTDSQIVQRFFLRPPTCNIMSELSSAGCNHIHGTPVFWTSEGHTWMYVWAENDFLRALRFDRAQGRFDCAGSPDTICDAVSVSTTSDPSGMPGGSPGMPGGMLTVSANGDRSGTGIVWASHPYDANANQRVVQGVLRAYDASDLTHELWNSRQQALRDDVGTFAKYVPPIVNRGRLYVPTFAGLSAKHALALPSGRGPALAASGDTLILAWKGAGPAGTLNVASSIDAATLADSAALDVASPFAPALAGAPNDRAYMAWADVDGALRVARLMAPSFTQYTPLVRAGELSAADQSTDSEPALAFGDGKLFMAWKARGSTQLRVLASTVDGAGASYTVEHETTLDETSQLPPALLHAAGKLYLAWVGADARLNVVTSNDGGQTFGSKITLAYTSAVRPALAALASVGSAGPDLHLLFSDEQRARVLSAISADDGDLRSFAANVPILDETTAFSPAAVMWKGSVIVAWATTDALRLKLARYTTGELLGYGLL